MRTCAHAKVSHTHARTHTPTHMQLQCTDTPISHAALSRSSNVAYFRALAVPKLNFHVAMQQARVDVAALRRCFWQAKCQRNSCNYNFATQPRTHTHKRAPVFAFNKLLIFLSACIARGAKKPKEFYENELLLTFSGNSIIKALKTPRNQAATTAQCCAYGQHMRVYVGGCACVCA